jgi:hypothetical protein
MGRIQLYTEGEQQWTDLVDKSPDQVIRVGDDADFALAFQKSARNSASPTLSFRLDLPTGDTVLFRTSLPLFLLAADLLRKQVASTPFENAEPTTENESKSIRGQLDWDAFTRYEKNAAVLRCFFGWPDIPAEGETPSVPDYTVDWEKAMKVRDVLAGANEMQRFVFLQELILATYEDRQEKAPFVLLDCTPEDVCVAGLRTIGYSVLRTKNPS